MGKMGHMDRVKMGKGVKVGGMCFLGGPLYDRVLFPRAQNPHMPQFANSAQFTQITMLTHVKLCQ
jgi:hypothetical protein